MSTKKFFKGLALKFFAFVCLAIGTLASWIISLSDLSSLAKMFIGMLAWAALVGGICTFKDMLDQPAKTPENPPAPNNPVSEN